jgi:hypothetical protein
MAELMPNRLSNLMTDNQMQLAKMAINNLHDLLPQFPYLTQAELKNLHHFTDPEVQDLKAKVKLMKANQSSIRPPLSIRELEKDILLREQVLSLIQKLDSLRTNMMAYVDLATAEAYNMVEVWQSTLDVKALQKEKEANDILKSIETAMSIGEDFSPPNFRLIAA